MTELRIEVGEIDLAASVDGARPARDLPTADLFTLTNELFWGEVTIIAGGVRFGGLCYVLDMVWGWSVAGRELERTAEHVFRAADGVGDYTFRRRDDDLVLVSLDRGPRAILPFADLRETTAAALRELIFDLVAAHPALAGNAALRVVSDLDRPAPRRTGTERDQDRL